MNILTSPTLGSSILNCVLLDQKHIYEAYKQVLSSKTQNSISLWMWASSEANAALRDIVMRFAELEILVVKLLQGYMKKFVEHRRVLKQVVEEEHNVADVRNQHLDYSKKAAKLSSKVDQHAKKRDSTKLKNLRSELQIARSYEEEKKEQLDAAVLRLEVLKASLVRNSLVMISDAGARLAQGLEKISLSQHKVSKMIPVIPVHLATPTPNNPSNTTCYPGPDATNNLVENVAQEIGIVRSLPQELSHLCEPLFKRTQYQSHASASGFYNNAPVSALVNHPLAKLNLAPPPYSPPSPALQRDYQSTSQQHHSHPHTPGVHTCRRMNRVKYYQNRESSYNSDGASPRLRTAGRFTDGYDEIHSDEATFDLNDSDFDDNFENIDLDHIRRSRSQTDAVTGGGAMTSSSIMTTPFSSEKHFCASPSVDANGSGNEQEHYSQPLGWDPANLLKDAATTNKIFAGVYNQISGQSLGRIDGANGDDNEDDSESREPYLNLAANQCNATNCVRCSREGKEQGLQLFSDGDKHNSRMSAAEFDALKRRDGIKVRSGSLHTQTLMVHKLKRQQLQSHSGSVDLSPNVRNSFNESKLAHSDLRFSKTGSEIEKSSNCSSEHVDLLSHMLDTVFSVEESEHSLGGVGSSLPGIQRPTDSQANIDRTEHRPLRDTITSSDVKRNVENAFTGTRAHPVVEAVQVTEDSAMMALQHSLGDSQHEDVEEGIYSNLMHHTWSSAPSLPDSCRSCICKHCIEAASNEEGIGSEGHDVDGSAGDDQCSNCYSSYCNSYVNYSNNRLREVSVFLLDEASDIDQRNPLYEECKDITDETTLTTTTTSQAETEFKGSVVNVYERTSRNRSNSGSLNDNLDDADKTTTVQRRHPKVHTESNGQQNFPNVQSLLDECLQPSPLTQQNVAVNEAETSDSRTRNISEDTERDKSGAETPMQKTPLTPNTNPKYPSHQLTRPPNKFGIRKALFRLKNSRLSTSEPNLAKKP
ncbi:uncharacterized protein LOC142334591 isoform X3 [Convolutriloba macropyga]|uniref:uncharacterized protein LOC142334591 isoform X3 n=1 Tax=Convolutriloba macropyga TaxID=536237 RepID=UPI003F51C782